MKRKVCRVFVQCPTPDDPMHLGCYELCNDCGQTTEAHPYTRPSPDPRPGLLVAARIARKIGKELTTVEGYSLACLDIARECERRAKEGK